MPKGFKFTPDTPRGIGRELAKLSVEALEELHSDEGLGNRPRFNPEFERQFGRKGLLIESLALWFDSNPQEWEDYKFFVQNEARIRRVANRRGL